MSVRTDLAVESLTAAAAIEPKQRGTYFQITEVTISNAEQAAAVGKPEGHYLTLETAALHRHNPQFPQLAEELGRELRAFLPESGLVLVAGLGNRSITPDALGVLVAERMFVLHQKHREWTFRTISPTEAYFPGISPKISMAEKTFDTILFHSAKPLLTASHQSVLAFQFQPAVLDGSIP